MEALTKTLGEIQIIERPKLLVGNKLLLTLMSSPVLQKSISMTGLTNCYHISGVNPQQVWVSDGSNIVLADTQKDDKLYSIEDPMQYPSGIHTVNTEYELIYINKKHNINKVSNNRKTAITFIKNLNTTWRPQCVHCSPSSGDLLVGMYICNKYPWTHTGKVMRYNNTGRHTQTIPHTETPHQLYRNPIDIIENNNGDVVVSDWLGRAVVVTSREGVHRFSYTGPPSGTGLGPTESVLTRYHTSWCVIVTTTQYKC